MATNWKRIFSLLNDDPPKESIIEFSEQNPWHPDEITLAEKISSDLLTYEGKNKLEILALLSPSMEPGKLILDYFDLIMSFLVKPSDLSQVDMVTTIAINALQTHVPSNSIYESRLTMAARKFLGEYVKEREQRWSTFAKLSLKDSTYNYRIPLDPARIPRLECVVFAFGMSKPLIFYDLLNELAMNFETRLSAFMLLKTFLIVEGAPTYYLIDSQLLETVTLSALNDTDVSVYLTSITILSIFLPIVSIKAVSKLDDLIAILINAIKWEIWYPIVLEQASKYLNASQFLTDTTQSDAIDSELKDIDTILLGYSLNAVRNSISQFFTVMYGMFPCNTLSQLSLFLKTGTYRQPHKSIKFQQASDHFKVYRETVMKSNNVDEIQTSQDRIKALLECHKFHPYWLLNDPQTERDTPWFSSKEASEIIIYCFDLRIEEKLAAVDSKLEIFKDFRTIEDVSAAILQINNFLHGPIMESRLPLKQEVKNMELEPVIFLKVYYIILMNEGFFKECMRQYHIMHIRNLRKQQIENQFHMSQLENMELKFAAAKVELENSQAEKRRLKSELELVTLRQATTEFDLNLKIQSINTKLKLQANRLTNEINSTQLANKNLEKANEKVSTLNQQINEFEQAISMMESKLAIVNQENLDLKSQLMAKENLLPDSNVVDRVLLDQTNMRLLSLNVINKSLSDEVAKLKLDLMYLIFIER
ncbi:hypothetical protein BC833DRAFT_595625 [Globomyces pollinis-pini]|nr:hypothetical protein BC833DRAFT_595625 [Globomyces pollinis-pini]